MTPHIKVTNDELLADLKSVWTDLGYVTQNVYTTYGLYPVGVIERRFGNWSKACAAAGVPMTRKSGRVIEMVTTVCVGCDEWFDRPKDDPSCRRCKVCRRNRQWAPEFAEEYLFA